MDGSHRVLRKGLVSVTEVVDVERPAGQEDRTAECIAGLDGGVNSLHGFEAEAAEKPERTFAVGLPGDADEIPDGQILGADAFVSGCKF